MLAHPRHTSLIHGLSVVEKGSIVWTRPAAWFVRSSEVDEPIRLQPDYQVMGCSAKALLLTNVIQ